MGGILSISKNFSPVSSFAGGVLLGLASSLHLLLSGRITGASGIIQGALFQASDWKWRAAFLSCLIAGGSLATMVKPDVFGNIHDDQAAGIILPSISGMLVGFGTQLGTGCTSGHGVCGIPRLSARSLSAVVCFMASGILTASVKGHFAKGLPPLIPVKTPLFSSNLAKPILLVATVIDAVLISSMMSKPRNENQEVTEDKESDDWKHVVIASACGGLFSLGLALSQMCNPEKVTGFLNIFGEEWDPSLAFVMGGAVLFNIFSFRKILKRSSPIFKPSFALPKMKELTTDLVLGSSIFGIGWGLCGFCPGPATMSIPSGNTSLLVWIGAMGLGMHTFKKFSAWRLKKTN